MSRDDVLSALVTSAIDGLDLSVYDVELNGGTLRVALDKPGGIDLESISAATRRISRALDDEDPIPGSYQLEVTSPGLDRRLRTAEHWAGAVGERVKVKLRPGVEGDRRLEGVVASADTDSATLDGPGGPLTVRFDEVERATTQFEWAPAPKPGGPRPPRPAAPADGDNHGDNHTEVTR